MNLGGMNTKKTALRHILSKLLKARVKKEWYRAERLFCVFDHLLHLQRTPVLFLVSTWLLITILIPVPGDPLLSSNLDGSQALTWCSSVHAGKTLIHLKIKRHDKSHM